MPPKCFAVEGYRADAQSTAFGPDAVIRPTLKTEPFESLLNGFKLTFAGHGHEVHDSPARTTGNGRAADMLYANLRKNRGNAVGN